jgi:subtilisin-like proprotein convertase family protein
MSGQDRWPIAEDRAPPVSRADGHAAGGKIGQQRSRLDGERRPRMRRRLLTLILAALLVLPIAEGTDPAAAKKKFRIVSRTFTSPSAIAIVDQAVASPYPSTVTVSGLKKAKITDVDLILRELRHDVAADIDILLAAPDNRNALVMSDSGLVAAGVTLDLDDSAAMLLPDDETNLSSGTFRPVNYADSSDTDTFPFVTFVPSAQSSLGVFNGANPNGEWQLFVRDDAELLAGTLGGWTLEITAKTKKKKR